MLVTMEAQAWRFRTDASKVTSYRDWLRQQTDAGLLSVDVRGDPWTAKYVESSYKKGIQRAYVDVNKTRPDFYEGTQSQFLQSAFHAPEMLSKLELLNTRTFEELKGVTAAMSQQMSRTLAIGLAQGQGPVTIARQLVKDLDKITKTRALVIARTEIIHAHAEGQLDSFDRLGIEKIGVMAEWSSAGDSVVCERCDGMEGETMTVAEARGMIPLHPNCRCAWKPTEEKKKAEEVGYRVPELPDTSEVKSLLTAEKTLRMATAKIRKAYRGGDKSLRASLLKSKEELAAVRNKMDDLARGVTPEPIKAPTLKPTKAPTLKPAVTSETKFATAEDYRQYLIQQVKAAKTESAVKLVDDLATKSKKAWSKWGKTPFGTLQRDEARKVASVVSKELKAAKKMIKVSVKDQHRLLDEVNSMVGEVELVAEKGMVKKYQTVVNDMLSWIPKTREVSGARSFKELVLSKLRKNSSHLGSYNHNFQQIKMFVNSQKVFAHEFGHHLGYQLKGFMRAQGQFFRQRTIGEKTVHFYADIRGKKDNWKTLDMYAGRVYDNGRTPEVVSVGLEWLWANPYKIAIKDPEWFNLIVSQLKGIPVK